MTANRHASYVFAGKALAFDDLARLRLRELWFYCKSENTLFWLVNAYFFLEYVRPQTLYPALDIIPYTKIVILLAFIMVFLGRHGKTTSNPENALLLAFSTVVLLSSIFALSPETSYAMLSQYIAWVLVYFIIINIVNDLKRFLIVVFMFLLYNLKMSQFAFRGWASIGFGFGRDGTGGGPGWFQNSGEFGIEMCIFFPLAVYFIYAFKDIWPRWKIGFFLLMPFTALTGMISSSSRGAIVGGIAVFCAIIFKSRRKVLATLMITIICIVAYAAIPNEQHVRFEGAGSDKTSVNRTERWEKGLQMANAYPLLGVGYANWMVADKLVFSGSGALSHNIFVECVSELGYGGLLIFILMIWYQFKNNWLTRKALKEINLRHRFGYAMSHGLDCALVGYLVSGFFVTVMYYPYFWINMALTVALNNICTTKSIQ